MYSYRTWIANISETEFHECHNFVRKAYYISVCLYCNKRRA